MGPAFIFQISDLNKKFGQRELLKTVNPAFYPGPKSRLQGPNGAGQSPPIKKLGGTRQGVGRRAGGVPHGRHGARPPPKPSPKTCG